MGTLSNNISHVGLDRFSDSQKLTHETEVEAYIHIVHELKNKKGWTKEQIYTQNQIQKIPEIKKYLGHTTPENIVKINENTYYVIEAKNKQIKLKVAINEAENDYANKINQSSKINALFITGIAGNDNEGYIASSKYYKNNKWQIITENDVEVTGLLSKYEVDRILELKNPHLKDVEISDEQFLKTAEEINGILHENAINKDYRAKFISALLLALSEKTKLNLDDEPMVLVNQINTKVDLVLHKHKKSDFSKFVHIDKPSSEDNHIKLKTAIIKTVQELLELNIQSAMKSGTDVLGKFYEVFLKYGNGAKEIGIVLTPRHITQFAVEVLDVSATDRILDPTCGTGGFLVSAFDAVRKKSSKSEFEQFKEWGLYGIEEQDPIVSLALVNMIFRGDGKNNIIEGNCFYKYLTTDTKNGVVTAKFIKHDDESRICPITKVLMNPPFPKKKTDIKEFCFIDHALKQMQDGGILFSVLPYPCLIKDGVYLNWRKKMLRENTLLSVVTFPADLFYPVNVYTVGIFIQKGIPHNKKQNVFWLRAINDGYVKNKGKRLRNSNIDDDLTKTKYDLSKFINGKIKTTKDIPMFKKTCPIDFDDELLELVPEAFLSETPPTSIELENGIDDLVRETVAFIIRNEKELTVLQSV